jgi:hypothetical protein
VKEVNVRAHITRTFGMFWPKSSRKGKPEGFRPPVGWTVLRVTRTVTRAQRPRRLQTWYRYFLMSLLAQLFAAWCVETTRIDRLHRPTPSAGNDAASPTLLGSVERPVRLLD